MYVQVNSKTVTVLLGSGAKVNIVNVSALKHLGFKLEKIQLSLMVIRELSNQDIKQWVRSLSL